MKKKISGLFVIFLALIMAVTSAFAVYAGTEDSAQADNEVVGSEALMAGTEGEPEAEGPAGEEPVPETFTVTWMNGDAVIEVDNNAAAGSVPAYDGQTPVKAADSQYSYTFAGWSDVSGSESGVQPSDLPAVTCDVTYYAAFSKTAVPHVHAWGSWTVTVQPTYFSTGTRVRYCSCGAYETEAIAKLAARNQWVIANGAKYYFGSNGSPVTGWVKMKPYKGKSVKWCYFAQDGSYVKNISKTTRNKWVKAGGYKFYFTKKKKPAGAGFNFIKNKLYHMNSFGAVMYGTFQASDGNTYTAAKNGSISGLAYYKYKYKTFVLVDISEQTLWFYKNGKQVMKTDVVTGTRGVHNTPTGTFKIRSKQKNIWLRGSTWNSHVDYWMAFKGSGWGLHDASWRTSAQFSNHKTYLSNGSHGCVNMRPAAAASLYGMVKTGTKVIIQN